MMKHLRYVISAIIIMIIISGAVYYFTNNIKEIAIESFEITNVEKINSQSITLEGYLYVNNPSRIDIPIKAITYDVILQQNNNDKNNNNNQDNKISSGKIPVALLKAKSVTKIPFKQEIPWEISGNLIRELLTQEKVLLQVRGTITINKKQLENYEIPFETKKDIKEPLKKFASEKINEFVNDLFVAPIKM